MSLRAFHLLFILASIALSLMMAVWGGVTYGHRPRHGLAPGPLSSARC